MVQVSVPLPKVYRFVTVEHVDETDVGCRGQKPNLHSFFSGLGKELFPWTCHFNVSRCFRDFFRSHRLLCVSYLHRLGNVLTNETDVFFAHQFNESAPCRKLPEKLVDIC